MPPRLTSTTQRVGLPLEWGWARRALPGVAICGDAEVVKLFPGGLLVGVIDGLGRGQEAALAAESAVKVLQRYGRQPLTGLVKRCHRTLMLTRGAALSLASFRLQENRSVQFAWLGVGNVEGWLLRQEARIKLEPLPLHGGIVGYYLPRLQETNRSFGPGDTLILNTDGIRSEFGKDLNQPQPAASLAATVLERHFRGNDDALVLVVQFARQEPQEPTRPAERPSELPAGRRRASASRVRRRSTRRQPEPARPIQEQSHDDFAE